MENDPFGSKGPESSDAETDDSSSKKKKKSKRSPLFNAPLEPSEKTSETDKPSDEKKEENPAEQLLRRILGQPEADTSKPSERSVEEDVESLHETTESEQDAPLESLSDAEQLEATEAYIAARQAELLAEQSTAVEGEDEAAVQERAADIALLEAMRRMLRRDHEGEQNPSDPVEEAYEATVHNLGLGEYREAAAPEQPTVPEPETLPLPPTATITLRREERSVDAGASTGFAETFSPTTGTRANETNNDDRDNRRRTGSALLVGGLVGYFVGRRKGRINTEKKFKTVEAKLTKQIEQVQQTVAQKEQQIRRLARESYASKGVAAVIPRAERIASKIEKQPTLRTEQLGLVTLKAVEAPRRTEIRIEPPAKQAKVEKAILNLRIESLSRSELLAVAADIKVGATNLRRVFETNLVSEVGLRRLLVEHERGGNVRETLEREITQKEMSYERDPRLRNSAVMGSLAAGKVVRADIDKPVPATVPQLNADDTATAADATDRQATNNSKTPPAAVAAAVTLVVVIAVLLVILFTSR